MKQISFKTISSRVRQWFGRPVVRRIFLLGSGGVLLLSMVVAGLLMFIPGEVRLGFQPSTCLNRSAYIWGASQEENRGMIIETGGGELCVQPDAAVVPGTYRISAPLFGLTFLRHPIDIVVPDLPQAKLAVSTAKVPLSKPLEIELSAPDSLHSYKLKSGEHEGGCRAHDTDLLCDIESLELQQGEAYEIILERSFRGKYQAEVLTQKIEVLEPVRLAESSIGQDELVFARPGELVLRFDKPLVRHDMKLLAKKGEESTELDLKVTKTEENVFQLGFDADAVPRESTIEVVAESVEATDGSTVEKPVILSFRTSGGPKVTGVNVGSSGVMVGTSIVVTFDQELSSEQPLESLVEVGGGVALQARRGSQLIFSTNGAARCGAISIALKPDIQSPYGISGQSSWRYNGRMSCYTISTIGYSAQGRAINAYHFGGSGSSVVYTGAIHGNEVSTKYLMDRWIQEIDANPGRIPANKRIIVVPAINPDGLARGTRVSSRGVDLNRNFATSDWQKDVQHVNGQPFPGGGGESGMSEPETKVIAGFISQQRPELVLSYHSVANLVISNGAGQANARASQYASMSGYRLSPGDGSEFGYAITGTADSYYGEVLGVPSLVIELGSHTYHQFERNRAAMWAMVN